MGWCSPNCQKWTTFSFSLIFLIIGILLIFLWNTLFQTIRNGQLNVGSKDTLEFKMFKETPIPMYTEIYLFNWTNHEEVINSKWTKKPYLQECGPYTFAEHHIREQISFNDNHTVTFKTKRVWHFLPEKTNGSLDDNIITINPILATIGNIVKNKHRIVDLALNFILREEGTTFIQKKKASEWLFDGYDDPLVDLVHKLNLTGFNVPFKKFGWFVERNGSIDYDGVFTIKDGTQDIRDLGRMTLWNGANRTKYYKDECGMVNGTIGELFYPVKEDITTDIFASDTCSTLNLVRTDDEDLHGIEGHKFIASKKIFDNGTLYPEMKCFNPGITAPSGVRNVSECKWGAPAFISFPHFDKADPCYLREFDGLSPGDPMHELYLIIEPETGIPLKVQASMQVNLKLTRVPHLNLLAEVKELFFPCMWFRQTAELTDDLANEAKLLLVLPNVGVYTGYGLVALGTLCLLVFAFMMCEQCEKSEEEVLLNNPATISYDE